MNFIPQWLANAWPKRRLMPDVNEASSLQALYGQVFNTPAGHELLEMWLEAIVLDNPRSTDPNECIAYAAKCAFVEDVIRNVDRANNPAKYQAPVMTQHRRVA